MALAAVGVLLLAPTWSQGLVRASASGDPKGGTPLSPSPSPSPSATQTSPSAGSSAGSSPSAASPDLSPMVTSAPPPATATPASQESLEQLLENSRLAFSPRAREAVQSHPVDLRLAALLVQLAATQPLSVSDLPIPDGSTEPLRTVVLDALAGQAIGADPQALEVLNRQISAQDEAYRAAVTQEQDGATTVVRLVLPPAGAP